MIHGHTDPLPLGHSCDAVVVGSGPGGASLARTLARAGWDVVVVEEGPPQSMFRPSFAHTTRYHAQEGGQMIAMGRFPLPVLAGRGVGGSSLINGAIIFRTPEHVLNEWAELLQDDRFSPGAMRPIFDELEQRIQVVPVSEAIAGENNMIVARGVKKLGVPGGLLRRNAPGCIGCGICNLGCPVGGKASVNLNLLMDARDLGTIVQADAKITGILLEGDRAVGVTGDLTDTDSKAVLGQVEIRAKVVVLAAGSIGSPRLLWKDGLAKRLGPVGAQLHLHPGSAICGRRTEPVHWTKGAQQGAYALDPDNPKVLPHTFNVPPEVLVAQSGKTGHAAKDLLMSFSRLCGLGIMVSDKGRGSVGCHANGRADLRYQMDERDFDYLKRGMVFSARVLLAGGAEEVTATAFQFDWHTSAESLEAQLMPMTMAEVVLYSSHPMSTNLMGPEPGSSVCDRRGRAHRMPGLYIADASVFPSSLGVNPQLTTMAIAQRIGEAIAEDEG